MESKVHRLHVPFLEGHRRYTGREKAESRRESGEILHRVCRRCEFAEAFERAEKAGCSPKLNRPRGLSQPFYTRRSASSHLLRSIRSLHLNLESSHNHSTVVREEPNRRQPLTSPQPNPIQSTQPNTRTPPSIFGTPLCRATLTTGIRTRGLAATAMHLAADPDRQPATTLI